MSFPRDPKARSLCNRADTKYIGNMQGNKTTGERKIDCTRIIVLRKSFSL